MKNTGVLANIQGSIVGVDFDYQGVRSILDEKCRVLPILQLVNAWSTTLLASTDSDKFKHVALIPPPDRCDSEDRFVKMKHIVDTLANRVRILEYEQTQLLDQIQILQSNPALTQLALPTAEKMQISEPAETASKPQITLSSPVLESANTSSSSSMPQQSTPLPNSQPKGSSLTPASRAASPHSCQPLPPPMDKKNQDAPNQAKSTGGIIPQQMANAILFSMAKPSIPCPSAIPRASSAYSTSNSSRPSNLLPTSVSASGASTQPTKTSAAVAAPSTVSSASSPRPSTTPSAVSNPKDLTDAEAQVQLKSIGNRRPDSHPQDLAPLPSHTRPTCPIVPALIAAQDGMLPLLKWLKNRGDDILHIQDEFGNTAAHFAAANGRIEVISWLIDIGLDMEARTSEGTTLLHVAAKYNHVALLDWLLEKLTNPSSTKPTSSSFVGIASNTPTNSNPLQHPAIPTSSITGGTPKTFSNSVASPLSTSLVPTASSSNQVVNATKTLSVPSNQPLNAEATRSNQNTNQFSSASSSSGTSLAPSILQRNYKASACSVSTERQPTDTSASLPAPSNSASPISSTWFGSSTPQTSSLAIMKLASQEDVHGCTPVHYAAFGGAVAVLKWFWIRGIDVNKKTPAGLTPFHMAAYGGSIEALCWLKSKDALLHAWNELGWNAAHYAADGGRDKAVAWLFKENVKIDGVALDGRTPAHCAASNPQALSVLKYLHQQGINLHAKMNNGTRPCDIALERKDYTFVCYFATLLGRNLPRSDQLGGFRF